MSTITIAGFRTCSWHQRTLIKAKENEDLFKNIVEKTFQTRGLFRKWLFSDAGRESFPDARAHSHTSSPFVWLDENIFVGGHDDTVVFLKKRKQQTTGKEEKGLHTCL